MIFDTVIAPYLLATDRDPIGACSIRLL